MTAQEVLERCLQVSGSFENGNPAYDAITGNFDGMGISVGILQWNAGTGSLITLLQKMISCSSTETVNAFFSTGIDTASIAQMSAPQALQFCVTSYLADEKTLTSQALADWQQLLPSDPSVKAQLYLAETGVLAHASSLAAQYTQTNDLRDTAFFFDIVTQSGGMSNSRGKVKPLTDPSQATYGAAIQMAVLKSPKTAMYWTQVCQQDPHAQLLLHYAYQRALLSRPEYVWDALSRRGAIACRGGVVHGSWFDFTQTLP